MRTSLFILVAMGLGFFLTMYFDRRRENYSRRHPGKRNPILGWLTGRDREEEDRDDDGKGGGAGGQPGDGGAGRGRGQG
jgi:hypothetical protein